VFGATLLLMAHGGVGSSGRAPRALDPLGGVLAACASLPLLAWRRAPLAVFTIAAAASALAIGLGYPGAPPIGPTVALYLLAVSRDELHPWTRWTTAAVAALFVFHFAAFAAGYGRLPEAQLAMGALVWGVAWFAGDRTRLRRVEIFELRERAARNEQEAQRERRIAIAEERARIARDLHDSAGHAINVIAVHAGAARLLRDRDPARSHDALATIEQVARQTVAEIDQIVRTLRDGDAHDGKPKAAPEVDTPPGLAALGTLIARQRSAGLAVTVASHGQSRPLPSATDQAAYRILQEALTNAARHGAGTAEVELAFEDRGLRLEVTNPALLDAGEPSGRSWGERGHGLVGMRERASLLGGELQAERLNGSFKVDAHLPYGALGG
jgi:signal transduction histidine kinase